MKLSPYSFNGTQINDGTNYLARFDNQDLLTPGRAIYSKRSSGAQYPAYAGKELQGGTLTINVIMKGTVTTQVETLKALFDIGQVNTAVLIAQDTLDSNRQWYVDASVTKIDPPRKNIIRVTFALKDPIWKTVNTTTESTWNITASGQTNAVTVNLGNLEAYPIYEITPTSVKSGVSFKYKRFIEVLNNKSWMFRNYPVELINSLDTATLVGAGKMLASGYDTRIYIDDAEEENRWLDSWNGATSKCWVNLNLPGKQTFTLATAIATTGAISSVDVVEDISLMPDAGSFKIDSERLTYTAKSISAKQFTGITRGALESTAATHLAAATVTWIPFKIYMYYGDTSLTTGPATDDTLKPVINLTTSTNTSHVYANFWSSDPRSAEFIPTPSPLAANTYTYTANQGTDADPASEIGIRGGRLNTLGAAVYSFWQITHPAGITNWNYTNGEKYNLVLGEAVLQYNASTTPKVQLTTWTTGYTIPATTVASTWQSWSDNRALGATYYHIRMAVRTKNAAKVEAADLTLTLDSSNTPTRTLGSEVSTAYDVNTVLKNNTTGESLTIRTSIDANQTLQIDTLNKRVTYLYDNSSRFANMQLTGSNPIRTQWLRLSQGSNTLLWTDANTGNISLVVKWQGRNN